jgi:Flp pilus assembly pilin Flp
MKLSQVGAWSMRKLSSRRGQNTVEYLMMVLVAVALAAMAGVALKKYMPGLFSQIESSITGAASGISSGGSGN